MTTSPHATDTAEEFTELKARITFSELVTYEVERSFEIPVEVAHSPRAIRRYLDKELGPDELADDCTNENFDSCEDRTIEEIQVLETTADHWRADGVTQVAINRYMRSVRGPVTVWLAPGRKRPTGRCTVCTGLTLLRRGARAASHRPAPGAEPCPGTGGPVADRNAPSTPHETSA
ncbi:hypothetical protein ACFY1P_32720 [Streptomyces sp. NPDC001407]|uniref:hypothetical protein n=1 Tax=Streptomyces sp. NPDC001407 TaxID=3364573 RepID=UPI0036B98799